MAAARGQIYLHVGMPKTGTTYLQATFEKSRDQLLRHGVELLPPTRDEAYWLSLSVLDRLHADRDPAEAFATWDEFVTAASASRSPRLLVSEELLGGASPEQLRRLVRAVPEREAHVVLTIRGLSQLLPSTWQQRIQQGSRAPALEDFVDRVVSRRGRLADKWWRERGVEPVVERWAAEVPPSRIHVVVVPRQGAAGSSLLERFCGVLGVPAGELVADHGDSNPALGRAQAELLRLVKEQVPRELMDRHGYVPVGKWWLARQHLAPQGGTPPRMPLRFRGWCEDEARSTIDFLRASGVDLVGDVDDLLPADADFDDAAAPSETELLAAAVQALASIGVERTERQVARRRSLRSDPSRPMDPVRRARRGRLAPRIGKRWFG
ncbi:hypothetical protein [Nocardioides sp.]|uniref:hypothetical protein n=1 Tax=Nocardioides sp. TaxID=35761 RepID=UPI0025E47041|nr:hypothetical protein [Nocardioides sp.]